MAKKSKEHTAEVIARRAAKVGTPLGERRLKRVVKQGPLGPYEDFSNREVKKREARRKLTAPPQEQEEQK